MGFFDDLESEVQRPSDVPTREVSDMGDYRVVVDKLKGGWVHRIHRMKPQKDKTKPQELQEVEVAWSPAKGRFTWRTSLAETMGRKRGRVLSEDTRILDEEGLLDALGQAPWIGQAALDALGIDRSRPEF